MTPLEYVDALDQSIKPEEARTGAQKDMATAICVAAQKLGITDRVSIASNGCANGK